MFFAEEGGPFYKWIINLCRIYFATKPPNSDSNSIPQMCRNWMLAVADVPLIPLSRTDNHADWKVQKKIEFQDMTPTTLQSMTVPPNNSLLSDKEMTCSDVTMYQYIENILKPNRSWQRQKPIAVNGNVKLPNSKIAVNPVAPTPKPPAILPEFTATQIEDVLETITEDMPALAEEIPDINDFSFDNFPVDESGQCENGSSPIPPVQSTAASTTFENSLNFSEVEIV